MTMSSSNYDDLESGDTSAWLVDDADGDIDVRLRPAIPLPQSDPRRRTTRIDDMTMCRLAKEEYDERTRRLKYFHQAYLGEPAWDILLDLYINEVMGLRAAITSVCIASGVPQSTALHVIRVLIDKGLVERAPDTTDRRRHWVTISNQGYELMNAYLSERANARLARPFMHARSVHSHR